MHSRQKEPNEAAMDTLAAPMTPSLKRFRMKPPVMMPSATAGRFRIPGRKDENIKKLSHIDCKKTNRS